MSLVNIRPLGSVVLVLPKPAPTPETESGITLADVTYEPETCGLVVAIGSNFQCSACECEREAHVAVGDWVLFSRGAGEEVEQNGRTVVLLQESDILAVVDETAEAEVV